MSESRDRVDGGVVRARRVELTDGQGRVRAVFGELESSARDGEPAVGIELYTADGEPRVSLAMHGGRTWLMLEMGGNARVYAGVNDATTDAVGEETALYLMDADGLPLIGWRVDSDGTLFPHPGGDDRDDRDDR